MQSAALVTDDKNPVRVAMTVERAANGNKVLVVRMKIHAGFHTYAQVAGTDPFIPTVLAFTLPAGYELAGDLQYPSFKVLNSAGTTVYEHEAVSRQEIKGTGKGEAKCVVSYQCCDAHICFPPAEEELKVGVE